MKFSLNEIKLILSNGELHLYIATILSSFFDELTD